MFFRRSFSISSKNTIAQIPLAQNPLAQIPPAPQVGRLNRPRCALWRRNSQTWVPLRSRKLTKSQVVSFFKRNDKPHFQIAKWHLCCEHLENAADEMPAKQTVQTSNHKGGWFLSKPPTKSRQRNPKPLSVHASCRDFSSSDLKTPFLFRAIREIATGQSSVQTIIVIQA